ncbi:MAG: tetratricopeptide repeat protein [Woeseiaceae bacterium]
MALLGELRRRNIFKVSLAYVLVSWLIIQVADVLFPFINAPDWALQILVLFLILTFPIAVLLAWAFELTPEGLKSTSDVDKTQSITVQTGRKLNHIVMALLGVAVIFLVVDNYIFPDQIVPDPDVDYRRSIAVIPFTDRSAAEENAEFLADGIHDDLLTRLTQISNLKVISRMSVMQYKNTSKNVREIGEELGVGSVLDGGVERAGDDLRVNLQLIDARTDETIWADTYDRELNAVNLFSIQGEVAAAIADELRAQLSEAEEERISVVPTESMLALESYFAAKQALSRRGPDTLLAAIDRLNLAVRIDPQFAPAWSGLAEAWLELPDYPSSADPMQVRMEATAAANRAIALDPDSPDAAAVLGWHRLLHTYDWNGAERSFQNALAVDSSNINALHWYSHLLSWQGKHDEAIDVARRAVAADPLSTLMAANLSYILADARQWDESFEVGATTIENDPYSSLMTNLWVAKIRARRAVEAAVQLETWARTTNRDIPAAIALGELIIRAQAGEELEAGPEALIAQLNLVTEVPEIYAAIGDGENTIAALSDAHDKGTGIRSLLSMRINPSYDFIRDDPRFIELLETIGLDN